MRRTTGMANHLSGLALPRRRWPFGSAGAAGLAAALAACSPAPDPGHHTPEVERLAAYGDADLGARNSVLGPAAAGAPARVDSASAGAGRTGARHDRAGSSERASLTPSNADTAGLSATMPQRAQLGTEPTSSDVHRVADWVVQSADNLGLPFIVVDKKEAKVYVFGPDGRLFDAGPALLGLARGDDSVPGIGERSIASIRPEERTTPAGRFIAELGVNSEGEDILWVDYDAAISMHRVRATKPIERRLQRLASPTVSDNRISYGCINLPVAFYDLSVKPTFAAHGGIVYVLPETRPLQATFPGVTPAQLASG